MPSLTFVCQNVGDEWSAHAKEDDSVTTSAPTSDKLKTACDELATSKIGKVCSTLTVQNELLIALLKNCYSEIAKYQDWNLNALGLNSKM